MRRRRHRLPEESPIDLTPMLDVVFILLIFFIVSASFVRATGVDIDTPRAQTSAQQPAAQILIAIDAGDGIWIDRQPVPLVRLRERVARLRLEHPQSAAVIQADRAASSGLLVQVMDQVRLAGVERVAVASRKP